MVINGESRFFLWLIMIIYGYSWLIMVDKSAKHHGSAVIVPQWTRRGLFASRLASTPRNCKYSSTPWGLDGITGSGHGEKTSQNHGQGY